MSKRAEEAALKAYPEKIIEYVEEPGFVVKRDLNRFDRNVYIQGYEQAEKDTIERALDWLKYAQKKKMSFDAAIDYFKAIMEEE